MNTRPVDCVDPPPRHFGDGGQPSIEAVRAAHADSMGLALTREQWMLAQPWRQGCNCGAIVCEPPKGQPDTGGNFAFYGGLPVLESCPPSVLRHIVDLHNKAIGYGEKP